MHKIYTLTHNGSFISNCYLVESNGSWAVVDPSVEYDRAVAEYPQIEGHISAILITHAHFDHIYAIKSWAKAGATVMVGERDASALSDPYRNCYLGFLGVEDGYFDEYQSINDGDKIALGDDAFEVISTPGHTPGGVCYKIGNDVFVGDTLFAGGGYGRCDLPGGDGEELDNSLFKLFSKMLIGRFYPGHGPVGTFEDSIKYFN